MSAENILNLIIVFGSLGLMIQGNNLVSSSLPTLTASVFRKVEKKLLYNNLFVIPCSIFLGLIMLNSSLTFIVVANMVATYGYPLQQAILIMPWFHLGGGLSRFILAFSNKKLSFILLTVASTLFFTKKTGKLIGIRNCLLGLGILFLGQVHMIPAMENLAHIDIIEKLLHHEGSVLTYTVLLLSGVIFGVISLSGSIYLTLAFGSSGLLDFAKCMFFIYGFSIGGSIFTWMLVVANSPGKLQAEAKRLAFLRIIYTVFFAFLFFWLGVIEFKAHIPLVKRLMLNITSDIQLQILCLYNFFILVSALANSALINPIYKFVQCWLPLTEQPEDPAHAKFLFEEALNNPATAMELIGKENLRFVDILKSFFTICRDFKIEKKEKNAPNFTRLHTNLTQISREVMVFRQELFNNAMSSSEMELYLALGVQQHLLVTLEESIYQFSKTVCHSNISIFDDLISTLLESLDLILLLIKDIMATNEENDLQILDRLMNDRKTLLESLRHRYISLKPPLNAKEESTLFLLTDLTDRIFWLYRILSLTCRKISQQKKTAET